MIGLRTEPPWRTSSEERRDMETPISGEKLRRVLGYVPRHGFEEVMRETRQALG
jgi:hypothetical protein